MSRLRRLGVCLILTWVACGVAPMTAHAAGCTGGSGVTVVVDFGPYGGVQTGCAPDPGNGLSALSQAGFSTVQVTQQPGFVCRIDGAPPAEDDACVRTPPETAYWSYWQAAPGSSAWTYTTQGAGSSSPADGATEGWSFGSGSPPGIAPPPNTVAPPPPPPATTTSSRPTTVNPPPAGGADPTDGSTGRTDRGSPSPTGATDPGGTSLPSEATTSANATSTSGSAPTTGPDPAGGSAQDTPAEAPDAEPDGSGNAVPGLLLAGVLAAALAGGALWQVRRRR